MILMECCCHSANWQSFIAAMPCLIKWLLMGVVLIFLMKYLAQLLELWTKNCHEKKMKEKSFENEKWWHFQKNCNTDSQKAKLEQQLEFERKLWDKLLKEQKQHDEIIEQLEDLKNQFKKLKAEYPKLRLDVEISEKNNGQEAK